MPYFFGSFRLAALCACLLIGLAGCSDSHSNNHSADSPDDPPTPATATAAGNAQKGPFQPGGTASAFQLQADGTRSDASVSGDITSNGGFSLTDIDWTGPTQIEMQGPFFNEFTGNFSMGAAGNATLHAAVSLPDDADANVNLFTHFVAARVQTLMANGTAFADARDQARDELAAIMGISAAPSTLDLLQDDGDAAHEDDSANLLLFSAATLAAGADQTDVDKLATDFADDGEINRAGLAAFDAIKQAAGDNPDLFATARSNLQNQYGVTPPDDTDSTNPAWTPGAPTPPAAPVAAITTSGPLQVGGTQSFDAGNSTGDGLTHAWDFGDGGAATGAQTTHVYADSGSYTVTLTVTDDADRSATDSLDLTITAVDEVPDPPSARINIDDNGRGANRGFLERPVSFDGRDSQGANLTYVWDFDDGVTANGAIVEHTYTTVGDYNPVLTVEDSAGQTSRRSALVTIGTRRLLLSGQKVTGDGALEEKVTDTEDFFGLAGDIDADIAVVGAPKGNVTDPDDNRDGFTFSRGSAFVYTHANGTWSRQNKLTAGEENEQIDAFFGAAVTVTGNTIVVGAPRRDDRTDNDNIYRQGAVYVFSSAGGGSGAPQQITVDGPANLYFGQALASDGGTVVIGSRGTAYVHAAGTPWSQLTPLTTSDDVGGPSANEDAAFGASVAIEGDTAVVGAPDGASVGSREGAAYVFTRVNDAWSQTAKLTPSDGESGDLFGAAVAISGNTIMVGSTDADVTRSNGATRSRQGAVYVFNRSGGAWSEQTKLTAADGKTFDNFGASIAMTGDAAVIGTRRSGVGTGYVFTRTNGSWSEQANFTNADDVANFGYGRPVVIDGDQTLVGAVSGGGGQNAGSAFFYNTDDLLQ